MSAITVNNNNQLSEIFPQRSIIGAQTAVLADIYQKDTNIIIWQRKITEELTSAVEHILKINATLQTTLEVTADSAYSSVNEALGVATGSSALSDDIVQLVNMFCYLFDQKRVGLRLTVLDRAMCPRFHVDRVPCRLVTTYQGIATEWLPHHVADRSKLGVGNQGKPDEQSGLFHNLDDIQKLNPGDVALLKGTLWQGNENAGLIHRSPRVETGEQRLLLTLDFLTD